MEAIFANKRRNAVANKAELDKVIAGSSACKRDGVFMGNSPRSRKKRMEHAHAAVAELGRKSNTPLTEAAITESYINACREVNAPKEADKAIVGLDLALRVLKEIDCSLGEDINENVEWSSDVVHDTPEGDYPLEAAIEAVHAALALIIARK